jgi:hypothetical protein
LDRATQLAVERKMEIRIYKQEDQVKALMYLINHDEPVTDIPGQQIYTLESADLPRVMVFIQVDGCSLPPIFPTRDVWHAHMREAGVEGSI